VGTYLARYIDSTLRGYMNPAVYRDAGLGGELLQLREEALSSPTRQQVHVRATQRVCSFLRKLEVIS
jgi:hypothetical protein